jgi:hypothetical protein
VNGAVQVVLAFMFGRWWGLEGIALAGLLAAFATALPVGVALLKPATGLTTSHLLQELFGPWLLRSAALLVIAAVAGVLYRSLGLVLSIAIAGAVSAAYVWHMRPLYVGLPLNARWLDWLVRIKVMPAAGGSPVAEPDAALDRV